MGIKMTNAMIRQSMTDCKNKPYFSMTSLPSEPTPIFAAQSETLTPPISRPMRGMSTFSTKDATILPNAAPMITPTAESSTGPFMANSLNSDVKLISISLFQSTGAPTDPWAARPRGPQEPFGPFFLGVLLPAGLAAVFFAFRAGFALVASASLAALAVALAAAGFAVEALTGAAFTLSALIAFGTRDGLASAVASGPAAGTASMTGPSTNCISAIGAESPGRGIMRSIRV